MAIAIFAWLLATVCLRRSKLSITNTEAESAIADDILNQVCQIFSIILFIATGLRSIIAGVVDSPWFFYQTIGIGPLAIHLFYQRLALYTEYLTLMLCVVLTCLSLSNPIWRSLNLLGSTLTLGYVTKIRQPVRSSLIYLTHLLGLTTIIQAVARYNISLPV